MKAGDSKPELLFITPVIPDLTGNGPAMRAGAVLEALLQSYSVSLLVIVLYDTKATDIPLLFASACRRTAVVPRPHRFSPSPLSPSRWIGPLARWPKLPFHVVHVFRLSIVPYVQQFLGRGTRRPLAHLDLDDIESVAHARLAALCRSDGDDARVEEFRAGENERKEREAFATFARIYVCSETDRAEIQSRTSAEVCVLPNVVRLPLHPPRSGGRNLLFVGTLDHYPNNDAARYLCNEIVPRIRQQSACDFQVDIVGPGADNRLRHAAARVGVRLPGFVPNLESSYRDAAVVVVPLRAGGGTRIKILEAFSYRRPVVTTPAGIEGIEALHEKHVLIGETAEELARLCARLLSDSELRQTLTSNAWELLEERYSIQVLKKTTISQFPVALARASR